MLAHFDTFPGKLHLHRRFFVRTIDTVNAMPVNVPERLHRIFPHLLHTFLGFFAQTESLILLEVDGIVQVCRSVIRNVSRNSWGTIGYFAMAFLTHPWTSWVFNWYRYDLGSFNFAWNITSPIFLLSSISRELFDLVNINVCIYRKFS